MKICVFHRKMSEDVMSESWAERDVLDQQEKAEEDARSRAMLSAARDSACNDIADEMVATVVTEECSGIAQHQHRWVLVVWSLDTDHYLDMSSELQMLFRRCRRY